MCIEYERITSLPRGGFQESIDVGTRGCFAYTDDECERVVSSELGGETYSMRYVVVLNFR